MIITESVYNQCFKIELENLKKLLICSVYISPDYEGEFNVFLQKINDIQRINNYDFVFIGGDFNSTHHNWNNYIVNNYSKSLIKGDKLNNALREQNNLGIRNNPMIQHINKIW